jgi:flagellar hook-associated protein 1 FlgK
LSDHTDTATITTAGPQSWGDIDVANLQAGNSVKVVYTDRLTNTQRTATLVRVDDPSALPLPDSTTADPNDQVIGVDWSGGLASVASQLNAAFKGKLQFSNPGGTTLRVQDDGAVGTSDITAVSATYTVNGLTSGMAEIPMFLDGSAPYSGAITSSASQVTGMAGRIAVNSALVFDPSKLVVYQNSGTPSGDSTRPDFIYDRLVNASLSYSPDTGIGSASAPYSGPLPSFLRQLLSQQGDAAQAAKNLSDGQDMVVSALQQRFNDESGVNMDQEMSNLLALQTAYGANAHVLSTVRDMIDELLKI